ncbi:hypothetical protein E4U60_007360 [Claviceps pazoutovae]|uniref:Uncharacterized protein n=1 Tax=Claviceps pazoutovae TaxID=1649127 RepID=A0A9P7SCV0_9HYPO|nr:hypothetical protein E4U60_007360 [Claviceps pazoutovae]
MAQTEYKSGYPIPHSSHPEPSFPQSSHPSTLPPLPTPDADVPYIEGTTTLDDLAITNTDIDCIKRWRENLGKNKQQRCDRCNCFWFDLDVVSGICKGCRWTGHARAVVGRE